MKKFDILYLFSYLVPGKKTRRDFRARYCEPQLIDREPGYLQDAYHELQAKKTRMADMAATLETLFLGSSHVAYGFNPDYFAPTAFNMGSTSQDLFTSYHILKRVMRRLPRLRTVLIGYDVFSRGWNLAYTSASRICSASKNLFGINYQPPNYLDGDWITCHRLKNKKGWQAFQNTNGYLHPPAVSYAATPEERASTHLRELRRPESQLGWLRQASTLLKADRRGIRLCVVIMPVRAELSACMPPAAEMFEELYALATEEGFTVLDFFNDADFEHDDFYDFDHLSARGAEKFSAKLKNKLPS